MNTGIEINSDEEYRMPCAEALLAATLALMTAHAQACCDNHRGLMARKITGNLAQLAEHSLLSAQFRTLLWNLRTRWQLQAEQRAEPSPTQQDPRLWHAATGSVQ